MKYVHIIKFLMTHDLNFLKECWRMEVINRRHHGKERPFSWIKLFKEFWRATDVSIKYLFWWRLASEMYQHGTKRQSNVGTTINFKLISKYGADIGLKARIGKNLIISHSVGLVINGDTIIGENFNVRQNVTIGVKNLPHFIWESFSADKYLIEIGDNVFIGANSCIIGDTLQIGNNVKIGAMTFINSDIPDNCTIYTQKMNTMIKQD